MQVHSGKVEGADEHRNARLYLLIGIAAVVFAILVTIFMASHHFAEGNSIISQICHPRGAHMCFFSLK